MAINGTFSKEIRRAVQIHVIRPVTDKAIEAAVRHGPTVVKTIARAVSGVLFRNAPRVPSRQTPVTQATFRIIEESEGNGSEIKPKKTFRKARKAVKE